MVHCFIYLFDILLQFVAVEINPVVCFVVVNWWKPYCGRGNLQ